MTRWQDQPFGSDADGWDSDTGQVGINIFANAIQVWTAFQDRPCSVAEASIAFNCSPQKIIEAIDDHAWMFIPNASNRTDYTDMMIEHEGE